MRSTSSGRGCPPDSVPCEIPSDDDNLSLWDKTNITVGGKNVASYRLRSQCHVGATKILRLLFHPLR